MCYLLNVAYLLLILVGLPWFLYKALTAKKYRAGLGEKFLGLVPRRTTDGQRPCLWFHAVSVGEVRALATVLEEASRRHPDWDCVVSTTTASGMQVARRLYADRLVFYCPLDFTWAVHRALARVRPDALVLMELELWPNLIRTARRRGARVVLANGRMSPRSYRGYRRVRFFLGRLLRQLDVLAVQDEHFAERFRNLGAEPERLVVTGSVKFDAIETDRANPRTRALGEALGIDPDEVVFVAGSTQQIEEEAALEAYEQLKPRYPRLRLVLVPRHPERFDAVADWLAERKVAFVRRSRLTGQTKPPDGRPVVLLDTLGELSALWGLAHVAFVGGSLFKRGGQNMIEPAAFGAAVLFGPYTWNFQDTVEALLACDGAVEVAIAAELLPAVEAMLADRVRREQLGANARRYVVSQQGATERTVEILEQLLLDRAESARDWSLSDCGPMAYNAQPDSASAQRLPPDAAHEEDHPLRRVAFRARRRHVER